ncbi:MAG: ribosomal subunit protein large subunit ribosomal protein [Candidatus Parcubacteria bacterium]|jgi:large subunit ribosomal protein L23
MALFGSTKEKKVVKAPQVQGTVSDVLDRSKSIIRPRITEKATASIEANTYVFEVTKDSNKKSIALAIAQIYKVKPVSVRIARTPAKQVFVRGKAGVKGGVKKAYVTLKKGDKIEFV